MQKLKFFLFSTLIICSVNFNAMNQNHKFDINKFDEKSYLQDLAKVPAANGRDFVYHQLIESMIFIADLKKENSASQRRLTAENRILTTTLLGLRKNLNEEKTQNKDLSDQNKSLQTLNTQLHNRLKRSKAEYYAKINAIIRLNKND